MKNIIYYFTGTGNSMRAAVKIAKHLGDAEIISMRSNPLEVSAIDCDTIGFVFPVYHWTMPEPAVQFVEKLKINSNAYIFGIAMPSLVVGHACEKLEEVLMKKGAKLSYGTKVNSVANYAIVYPPMPSPKFIVPKTEKKLDAIADAVKNKQRKDYPKCSAFIRKRYPKVMPQYKSLQQFADEPFTISEDCISCGLCAKLCPCHNIVLAEGKPAFLHQCAQCMSCICFCPKRAIGYKLTKSHFEQLADSGYVIDGFGFDALTVKENEADLAEQVAANLKISKENASVFCKNMIVYTHGLASYVASGLLTTTKQKVHEMMLQAAEGFMLQIGAHFPEGYSRIQKID